VPESDAQPAKTRPYDYETTVKVDGAELTIKLSKAKP
jgi:hypothetical protein